jgi:hypothetical protein
MIRAGEPDREEEEEEANEHILIPILLIYIRKIAYVENCNRLILPIASHPYIIQVISCSVVGDIAQLAVIGLTIQSSVDIPCQ